MTSLRTDPAQLPDLNLTEPIPPELAASRVDADHAVLLRAVEGRTDFELSASYRIGDARPGEFCDSLHDLLAHVLMWDEIAIGLLQEAARGRTHWALDEECETRAARMQLSWSGVAAGRHLPAWLLLHRLVSARSALGSELRSVDPRAWASAVGDVVRDALTAAGARPFWRAAHHLEQFPYAAAQ